FEAPTSPRKRGEVKHAGINDNR
ncbi:MAG: hypothetical protein JWQ17_89, partial [Tardiphaga sp.]|nr:hypothetical protein [Tardiphaga sp.]